MSSSTALIVASITEPPEEDRLTSLSAISDVLEVRADLVRQIDVDWLRSYYEGDLLFTLRSREEGGASEASIERRHRRLAEAARHYDLIDLEVDRDLVPELLSAIAPMRRMISWHGAPSTLVSLQGIVGRMSREAARLYKLVPAAEQPGQEMAPLALLHSIGRRDVIAFATGTMGSWTRLIAPRLGAPVVFGSAGKTAAAPGQISVDRLVQDYGLPELPAVQELCGLVGADIDHSLSPRLHNRMYRRLVLPLLYLPFHVEAFGEFWLEVVEGGAFEELGFRLRGLSITAPHKRIASAVGGACSPLVEWLGSANTLVWREDVWEAESTDGEGVGAPLRARSCPVSGERAAVLGAGGAGRAAAVALRGMGAEVTLVNRDIERGRKAAAELRVTFSALSGFDPAGYKVLVHATPLGRQEDDPLPLQPHRLDRDAIVVDMVYRPAEPTRLVEEVRAAGRQAVDGREVLVAQATEQFRLMTGQEMPVEPALEIVGLD